MNKLTTNEIKALLDKITQLDDPLFESLQEDSRKSVQQAIKSTKNRLTKTEQLKVHFEEMKEFENHGYLAGYEYIAGIDEVGRGPLAGPVVTAAVILPKDFNIYEVNDSKQLSLKKRDELFEKIEEQAIAIGIGIKSHDVIDDVNIYQATKLAMNEAVANLSIQPDLLLIDAMTLETSIPQEKIIKGDARSISIACASIIAKVTRDRMMEDYDLKYPGYGFSKNAGYGTKEHLLGLETQGICPIHRKTFAPIKNMI
ncbi:ribonuclease HII [Vagococcus carniphilus]|uniref:Ribonuclease HII n=1 Tax=Vagococcus carniphilus TaxID=218144 RepID=A0AAW8U777_9ENTE|nr:ribonuclease HII [Vagococcus carniphilus]MDT2829676.1 ribonuclease HII [Vagococcus carniphilus]MDT2833622.1 ribonuclease HII [Vagococcus carniphilus]MDT2839135.1 ribonuclease HII [Vagococcus carniphilus]MDT2853193.1 ribonuclease HII [Vagococcus carniphilus]MDT2865025.1 ribonuclease HII [Vagococcus carniphilus]